MDKLQWGNRKRMRCIKLKDSTLNGKSDGGGSSGAGVVKKKVTSRVIDNSSKNHSREGGNFLASVPSPHHTKRSGAKDNRKASTSLSPEKEDRYYMKRGFNDSGNLLNAQEENQKLVWPRLLISLSSKEKEEDFMLMKGCKPSQRSKKRAKVIQRTILLASPGAWLSGLCRERYEVREKKTSKKKPRGLKAMGITENEDSE